MPKKLGILSIAIAIYTILAAFIPTPAQAALLPACSATGACGFCDILGTFITLGKWLVTGGAGLALILIVWAGVGLAMSGGNPEKIQAAKKQIGGAILGLGMVLVAFQFVSILIGFVVTPSQFGSLAGSQSQKAQDIGSLKDFLLGVPWWSICSERDLREKAGAADFPSTANCKYWGDGAICQTITKEQQARLGRGEELNLNRCCQGACGSGECVTQTIAKPVALPPVALPAGPTTDISGCNLATEQGVRDCLWTKGRISINKSACPNLETSTNCTSVVGLSADTVAKLVLANSKCDYRCILITGGTEEGPHAANTAHGNPNVVDIDTNPANVGEIVDILEGLGLQLVSRFPGTYGGWFICDESGQATACNVASHVHVQF